MLIACYNSILITIQKHIIIIVFPEWGSAWSVSGAMRSHKTLIIIIIVIIVII